VTGSPSFSTEELQYMLSSYNKFVQFLHCGSLDPTRAVSVRAAMFNCQYIIRRSTLGNTLLEKCKYVENFNHTYYITHLKVGEIVPDQDKL
jgi:hypothetical protein